MKDVIAAVGAYGQGLGVVFEVVGWGFGALVVDFEEFALFYEGEGGVGARAVDGAGLDVAGYPEVHFIGFFAHILQF